MNEVNIWLRNPNVSYQPFLYEYQGTSLIWSSQFLSWAQMPQQPATWIILNRKSPVAPADPNKHKHGAVNVHFKVSGVHISLYLIFNWYVWINDVSNAHRAALM